MLSEAVLTDPGLLHDWPRSSPSSCPANWLNGQEKAVINATPVAGRAACCLAGCEKEEEEAVHSCTARRSAALTMTHWQGITQAGGSHCFIQYFLPISQHRGHSPLLARLP